MIRFVVCVDIEADTVKDGYRKLLDRMNGNDWESTDEVYGADGEPVVGEALETARLAILSERMEGEEWNGSGEWNARLEDCPVPETPLDEVLCPECGESYSPTDDDLCPGCIDELANEVGCLADECLCAEEDTECREAVCWCHDTTGEKPEFCSHCGCRS